MAPEMEKFPTPPVLRYLDRAALVWLALVVLAVVI